MWIYNRYNRKCNEFRLKIIIFAMQNINPYYYDFPT